MMIMRNGVLDGIDRSVSSSEPQDEVESGLLLDVVVGE